MIKVSKAKLRRYTAALLAKTFIDSGEAYTSTAAVYSVIRSGAYHWAEEFYSRGIVFSKSSYGINLIPCTAGMFMRDASLIVHAHFYPLKKS